MNPPLLPQPRSRVRRSLLWGLKFFLSIGLIGYLLSNIGITNALERVSSIPAPNLIGAFCLILLQAVLGSARWRFVVEALGAHLSILKAILITFVSLFFNQFLPSSVGADIVRVWQVNRAGLALPTAVTSVLLERFGNLLCVIAMTLATIPVWTQHFYGEATRSSFLMTGVIAALLLIILMNLDRLPTACRQWTAIHWLGKLARDSRLLFLHPQYASLFCATAIAGQLTLVTAALLLAEGLGIKLRLIDFLATIPAVALVSSLPISVAGWGVREFAMVSAFGMLSVPAESALALSLVLALTGVAVSLPGGLAWLLLGPEHLKKN